MLRHLGIVLVILYAGLGSAAAQTRTVTMTGTGEVRVAPDRAVISVGVEVEAATAEKALAANSARMREVMAALARLGVDEADIRTSDFALNPRFENRSNSGPLRVVGFTVSSNLTVRVVDLPRLGAVMDALVKAGANRINGVNFTVSDPAPHLARARTAAVADARRRAETYAAAAGVTLGPVLDIREGSAGPSPRFARTEALAMDAVPIAEGRTAISAAVTLTFAIE